MDRQAIMSRLEDLIRTHKNGVMVSGFTVHETAMSDCVFTLGDTEPCIRRDYPAAYSLILQLEGPYALPPDRVRNSRDFTFLTEEEFGALCAQLSDLLDRSGPVDEEARDRFVAEWKKKNGTKRG